MLKTVSDLALGRYFPCNCALNYYVVWPPLTKKLEYILLDSFTYSGTLDLDTWL